MIIKATRLQAWASARVGRRPTPPPPPPSKIKKGFGLYWGPFCYFFFIWGPFCYVFLIFGGFSPSSGHVLLRFCQLRFCQLLFCGWGGGLATRGVAMRLLGGFGGMLPRKKNLNGAIWCV